MKYLSHLLVSALIISGCGSTDYFRENSHDYMTSENGSIFSDCSQSKNYRNEIEYNYVTKSGSHKFWKENNLPRGTLYWLCEGEKPVLPKDCQGNSLTTPQLRQYWKQYNLPVGTKEFNCSGGIPNNVREEIAPTLITNRDIKRQIT